MQDNRIIDLHCHLLPQLDDGSDSVEMSLEMLRREMEQGVGTVCATSHYYADQNSISAFCERRAAAWKRLQTACCEEKLPRIILAAEVHYFPGMEEQPLECLCIEGTKTLLLEMPFADWTDLQVETVMTLALDCGFRVILAHPERFCFSEMNRYKLESLARLPIGWQVNAASLMRWRTRRLALELLEIVRYPLLGSDCHDLAKRPPNLKEGRMIICKKMGEGFLRQMDENAETVLEKMEWSC